MMYFVQDSDPVLYVLARNTRMVEEPSSFALIPAILAIFHQVNPISHGEGRFCFHRVLRLVWMF